MGYTKSVGAWYNDIYLMRIDSKGDTLWTNTYGGEGEDYGNFIRSTSDGGCFIVGGTSPLEGEGDIYLLRIDSKGNILWTKTFYGEKGVEDGISGINTSDGGWFVVGGTSYSGAGNTDVCLLRIDGKGDTLWTKIYGGKDIDMGYSVISTSDGDCFVVGTTYSSKEKGYDLLLIKTDLNGNIEE